ncbi:hypothetical protein [Cognatishimia sp. F0-27]|uniref:hypothetical protein n=1 Tax=Cognatishimia sp. F0-27 TaxID=2816855 RepID=UPI001D0C714B|nr:hypothetical protein [Cognatishimia sp. F0-27]MCC1494533.1 hypothetical protein [Cognatishimia sp. F0-27]
MHFDFAHAIVAAILMYAVFYGMERSGLYVRRKDGGPRWSWPLFGAVFVVMAIFNLL